METRERWGKILLAIGGTLVLLGTLDPMEGSVAILAGSALTAVAAYLGTEEKCVIRYRVWVFMMIAFGVASMFGMSAIGGIGGPNEPSLWWGLLVVPYLIGLPMALWGPKLPKWLYWLSLVPVFLYCVVMPVMAARGPKNPHIGHTAIYVIVAVGVLIFAGAAWRIWKGTGKKEE